ncbi:MAG TPA: radical SAM protein [Verrucomicrobiae bacterium]|nr:radical SAM protein [Verrucomicrobiae bacterium]
MNASLPLDSAWVLGQRPARNAPIDPFKPRGVFLEEECADSGRVRSSAVILLANKECPWRCLMCDLWKQSLDGPTPPGAIPKQIELALAQLGAAPEQLKLYNSGSFFDMAAIPVADYPAIAEKIAAVDHVVVESHPRLIGERSLRFRDLLDGSLEVAMGLETVHPLVLPRLNKRFDLEQFARAARFLVKEGISARAFVLVKPPFLPEEEAVEWALKTAEFAFDCGVKVVTLIPTRAGNGAMDALMQDGEFSPPRLATLEQALEQVLKRAQVRVFADTWDLDQFSICPVCLPERRQRIHQMNLTQRILPAVQCEHCSPASILHP